MKRVTSLSGNKQVTVFDIFQRNKAMIMFETTYYVNDYFSPYFTISDPNDISVIFEMKRILAK